MWYVQIHFTISRNEIEPKALKAPISLISVYMYGIYGRGRITALGGKRVRSLKSFVLGY